MTHRNTWIPNCQKRSWKSLVSNKNRLNKVKKTKKNGRLLITSLTVGANNLLFTRPKKKSSPTKKTSSNKSHTFGFNPSDDELDETDMVDDYEELEIDEEDANVLDKFLPSAPKERRTLADLIMDKINEKNAADERRAAGTEGRKDKWLVLADNWPALSFSCL